MATTVHEKNEVELMDGQKITLRPLKISLLRPFMKEFDGLDNVSEDNDQSIELLMRCVAIAMEQYGPDILKGTTPLEELIDLPTVYKIIEAASGVNLGEVTDLLNITTAQQ